MRTMTASLKNHLGEALEFAALEPVAIERHGRVVAYLIPPGDADARPNPRQRKWQRRDEGRAIELCARADFRLSRWARAGDSRTLAGIAVVLASLTGFDDSFALLHQRAHDDALPLAPEGVDVRRLRVKLLTPLDLAVSKLSRFSEHDQADIRALAQAQLIGANALRRRAEEALPDYVGNLDRIRTPILLACRLISNAAAASQR